MKFNLISLIIKMVKVCLQNFCNTKAQPNYFMMIFFKQDGIFNNSAIFIFLLKSNFEW